MSLCQPDKVADSHNLMVVLAHLQGVAATFRVGRHHHRGPLHEGRGLTHALTHTAPTDLTVAAALVRKAYSKRRRSRLWSKPVNLRTWGLVSDSIVMVQALAELRYGVVAYTRAKQCEIWAQFQPNPPYKRFSAGSARPPVGPASAGLEALLRFTSLSTALLQKNS